jgi:hypothetical protein
VDSIDVRKALWVSPPRAYGAAGPNGQPIVVATSTSATYLELDTTTFGQSYSMGTSMLVSGLGAPSGAPQGLMGCFISIYADAQDLGVIFGQTLASVTGSNVPALAQNGASLTAGVYTGAAGVCYRIAAGTSLRVLTQVGIDKYLAWVAAGTGQIRIYQSSAVGLDG